MTATIFKWTLEDWHKLVDAGILADKKVELLEGNIIEMSPEGIPHRYTNQSVGKYLESLLVNRAYVSLAFPITLDNSEPEPDIAIVRPPLSGYSNHHPYAEDIYWLIEISNRTIKKDLGHKATVYAKNNIPEYWVINLINKKVIVHTQPNKNKYQMIEKYKSGIIKPVAFPDVEVQLNKLLLY